MARVVVADAEQLARAYRDAGHEVVYLGADQSPEQVVGAALQEDAAAVVITAQQVEVKALLKASGADDVQVVSELIDL